VHWLSTEVETALDLARAAESDAEDARARRRRFLDRMASIIDALGERDGLSAAFASYEGLLVATSGEASNFEGLAALAQAVLEPARESASELRLGALRQMVLVGEDRKLALIRVGPVVIGLVAPVGVDLAAATS
jgi:predicted regulator of Ras-like GTPase activity (Roadblock/LC7/MglB family)